MTIIETLIKQSCITPEKVMIRDKDRSITSFAFVRDICNAASNLSLRGVVNESNVIVYASNSYAFICSYFAVHFLGARCVVVDPKSESGFLQFIENKVQPCCTVDTPEELLLPANVNIGGDSQAMSASIADIIFTSGTTAEPSGVTLTHQQILDSTINIIDKVGNDETDRELLLMPLSHSFGLGRMRSALLVGTILVIGYPLIRMKQVLEAMTRHQITGFAIVPAAWEFIILMSGDQISNYGSQIKYIELGSASFSAENRQVMRDWFPDTNLLMNYGLTEVPRALFTRFHADPDESSGLLGSGAEVRILDENSKAVANGIEGEIALRSDWMFSEYLDIPKLTTTAFCNGFFKTGDSGVIKGEYLFLRGRLKEQINVGGKKVNPVDVEVILKTMRSISDCACVSIPDPQLGEVVKAFIVLNEKEDFSNKEIENYLQDKLPNHMRPRYFEVIDQIPRTAVGKIQRLKLSA